MSFEKHLMNKKTQGAEPFCSIFQHRDNEIINSFLYVPCFCITVVETYL